MVSSHSVAALVADVGPSDAGTSSMSFRRLFIAHWHMTMTYCAIYFSFGMCVALLGPTILDLGCVTSTPMRVMGWLFFIQLACSLVGTILAGYLTKWFVLCDAINNVTNSSFELSNSIRPVDTSNYIF